MMGQYEPWDTHRLGLTRMVEVCGGLAALPSDVRMKIYR